MTQAEIEQAIQRHEARLEEHEERMRVLDQKLDRIAEGQATNMDQIGRNAEAITRLEIQSTQSFEAISRLGIMMEDYFRRLRDIGQ